LASEAVEFYADYFGLPYPLPKLDLVACHTLNVRAMENWGCITFLRDVILTDPNSMPSLLFQRNARTVTHEVSHMWFGNLVTMEWWDDIWLNEGFARFCEHYCLDKLRPEFLIWDKYMY
jgi:aminopeptidase N